MVTSARGRQLVTSLIVAGLMAGTALVAPQRGRAQGPDDPNSKGKELIARAPFDRITLIDDTSWEVEPLAPRPLPPYDAKKAKAKQKKATEPPPREGNIGLPGQKAKPEANPKDDEDDGSVLIVHTLEGEVRDFRLRREHLKSVAYFEDLIIAEAGRLVASGNYAKAFEYLLMAKTRQPAWPGLEEMVDRLLFEEGSHALLEGDGERGLRLLGELYARRPAYPGLGEKLAGSFAARIKAAVGVGAFAKGRQVLRDFRAILPDHLAVKDARAMFEGRAREIVDRASRATGGERLDLLLAAAAVWPGLAGLDSAYREAFLAMPTLDVAVADLPAPVGPWVRSAASGRTARLLYRPLLASTAEEALKGAEPDQLAAGVESFDLSRGLRIKLRTGMIWGDGSRPVSAIDVARSLADRAVPTHPGYSARWADLLDRVEATEEDQVELRLARPSLRPETWLVVPVGPAHAGVDGWVSTVGQGRRPVGDGPYRWLSATGDVHHYLATAPPGPASPKVRRLREAKYDSPISALAAFIRGEVSLIEAVPADRVGEIAAIEGIKVGRYATPSLHRIAVDGRTEVLRNRSLRRALSLAVDRKSLLEETVLRHPAGGADAVADGPFLKGSYADVPDVAPFDYDPLLARMLVAAARKELGGGVVRLTFEYPPTAVARSIAPRLAEAWNLIGVEIAAREVSEGELERKLRAGGRFDLAYRASRPGEPAFDAGPTICPGYDAPPTADPLAAVASPRILQLLLQLDRAPETTAAQSLVLLIDRESRDELPILPLWQLVEYYGYRARVKGVVDEAPHLYQGIEAWEVEPWFPNDPS